MTTQTRSQMPPRIAAAALGATLLMSGSALAQSVVVLPEELEQSPVVDPIETPRITSARIAALLPGFQKLAADFAGCMTKAVQAPDPRTAEKACHLDLEGGKIEAFSVLKDTLFDASADFSAVVQHIRLDVDGQEGLIADLQAEIGGIEDQIGLVDETARVYLASIDRSKVTPAIEAMVQDLVREKSILKVKLDKQAIKLDTETAIRNHNLQNVAAFEGWSIRLATAAKDQDLNIAVAEQRVVAIQQDTRMAMLESESGPGLAGLDKTLAGFSTFDPAAAQPFVPSEGPTLEAVEPPVATGAALWAQVDALFGTGEQIADLDGQDEGGL